MPKLTDATIKNSPIGERSDAQTPGLILITRASTSKARPNAKRRIWTYRFTFDGKRLKMGLGAYPTVSLEEARQKAQKAASELARGLDPHITRRPNPANITLRDAVEAYLVDALPRLSHEKTKQNLQYALRVQAKKLHDLAVSDIGTRDVAALLKELATESSDRAEKTRAALRGLFAHVAVDMEDRGLPFRNPVSPDGLKAVGYAPTASKAHHPALDPAEAPAFMTTLRAIPSTDARLLEFAILTVARAGAARLARFNQVNVARAVWTIQPEQLKDKAHRNSAFLVPLSPRALAIVEEMRALRPDTPPSALIFPGADDMTLIKLLRRMCRAHPWRDRAADKPVSVHGFRATFRSHFQGAKSRHTREVIEIAMGHKFHDQVESAYARDDLLEERRQLLDDWARYLDKPAGDGAEIIPMRRA